MVIYWILTPDHHNQHRLDQAVILVLLICKMFFGGKSYECFTFFGAYLLEIDLETIIMSTVSIRRFRSWYSLTTIALMGQSYECFTFLGVYLLEFDLETIIMSTASIRRFRWWYFFF